MKPMTSGYAALLDVLLPEENDSIRWYGGQRNRLHPLYSVQVPWKATPPAHVRTDSASWLVRIVLSTLGESKPLSGNRLSASRIPQLLYCKPFHKIYSISEDSSSWRGGMC
jgi:hypothetical protein